VHVGPSSGDVGGGYEIVQIATPPALVGKTLQESDLRGNYGLNLITVGKSRGMAGLSSTQQPIHKVLGIPAPARVFEEDDILVLFGLSKDIRRVLHGS
jgi:trk system potassium uptake protein TrkA